MDYFLAKSKFFRLHSILHDAAGSVKTTTLKGPGYCCVLPRFPSSCFLGCFSVYILNFLLQQYMQCSILSDFNQNFSENSYHHEPACFGY